MPPKSAEGDDPFPTLRPNAPVSVLKAAKASLKEPTRPHTPAEVGRQLFSLNDFGNNRPSSSYGVPTSKNFYEGSPKLALPKLEPFAGRPDAGPSLLSRGSILDAANVYSSTESTTPASTRRSGNESSSFSTATQGYASPSGGPRRPSDGLADSPSGRPPAAGASGASGRGSSRSMTDAKSPMSDPQAGKALATAADRAFAHEPYVGDAAPDPRRNEDLPPRPSTSRGRPSSAQYNEQVVITERFEGPPPGVQDFGAGQVLDLSAMQGNDDSTDDEEYRHLYTYAPAAAAADEGHATPSGLPPKAIVRQWSAVGGASAAAASALEGLDLSDPFVVWRVEVEETLQLLSSATAALSSATGPAAREAMTALMKHCTTLGAHVEHVRKQQQASKWLNSPSLAYRDGGGASLSMREVISEHVFRLMDSSNAELLLKACGIILRIVKSKQPLLQASKLVYRLSKDTANDAIFRREGLLEPLLRTVHVMVASISGAASSAASMHEPLVYLNGCLKNVSNDTPNQRGLVKLGALQVLGTLLTQLANQAESTGSGTSSSAQAPDPPSSSTSDMVSQVAVQVTGVLRNLAVMPGHAPTFVSSGALTALRGITHALGHQQEVVLNVGRVLSKLSLNEECQAAMEADAAYAPLLMSLLSRYANHRAILLRVAFVLGNLTTSSDGYRQQIAAIPGALQTVVSILERYALGSEAQADEAAVLAAAGSAGSSGPGVKSDRLARAATREECIIKMLRLTANLSIHPEVGPTIARQRVVADALVVLLENYSYESAEELVLNCVCALTNLSFYHSNEDNQILQGEPAALLRHVTPLLMCDNDEAMVEAARAYGNFSRTAPAREYMEQARVLEAMLLLLDHSNNELLYSICGTLINFTADSERKEALVQLGGVTRLVEVMERAVTAAEISDVQASILMVIFKTLYNICADDAMPGEPLGEQPAVTEEEITTLEAIIEHIRAAEELAAYDEVLQLADRLESQLHRISNKLQAQQLEPL